MRRFFRHVAPVATHSLETVMEWLNYHHLHYFWITAREGGITRASAALNLSHPTISGQIRMLERALGEKLFKKRGRGLELTEMGRVVYRFADEIFSLGRELLDTVRGRPTGQPLRLVVGIADVMPKLVVRRLLEPALRGDSGVRIVCREDKADDLFAALAAFEVDVVLTDAPLPSGSAVRAFNHLIGECEVGLFATAALARKLRPNFPRSLDGAPLLLPTDNTQLRRTLDHWFDTHGVRPRIVAECEDSALLKVLGQDGYGVFPAPLAIADTVRSMFEVQHVGRLTGARERFFAISPEKRLKNPAVVAICDRARESLFKT